MCDTQLSMPTPYACKQRHRKLTRSPHPWKRLKPVRKLPKLQQTWNDRALDTMELPSQIRNQAVRFTGQCVQGQMPNISATKKMTQRARVQNEAPLPTPADLASLVVPDQYNSTILHPTSTNYSYSAIVGKPIPIAWWFLDVTTSVFSRFLKGCRSGDSGCQYHFPFYVWYF